MSRSGYSEGDCDDTESLLASGRWQAQLRSAIRGKRGQKFLLDLIAALDSLPEQKLIANDLQREGSFCALGALAHHPKQTIELDGEWEDHDWAKLGNAFDIIAERNQTDFQIIADRVFEMAFNVTLRNHKELPVTVTVNEPVGGDWKIIQSSHPYEKTAAFAARFKVPIAKDAEAKLNYRVRVRY